MIPHLGKRVAAWGVDAILALMLTGLLIMPLLAVTTPQDWAHVSPVPLMWALILVLLPLLLQGATPGKRWMKLALSGQGCLICRELRRSGWALLVGLGVLVADLAPFGVPNALIGFGIGFLLWQGLAPFLSRAPDFPHNTSTGFAVIG